MPILTPRLSRRAVLGGAAAAVLPRSLAAQQAPAAIIRDSARPQVPCGVQSGDAAGDRAIIWSRCDRPARMWVEWDTDERFRSARRVRGPHALENTDFTARVDLTSLPPGETVFYRVVFQDLADLRLHSLPAPGRLRTPPSENGTPGRDAYFAWSGDTVGQGWGIDVEREGMKSYERMWEKDLDFFIHSGDTIYADNPLQREVKLDDGTVWKNLVTEEKSKVAETLDEFRGNHRYNFLDDWMRRFNSEVQQLFQWDDHETLNNWYPGKVLDDPRYTVKSVDLLAARGKRAFLDYAPIRHNAADPEQVFRGFRYGPLLEVLMLDERSYRGPNTGNRQEKPGPETVFLGTEQMRWLKRRLLTSRATWKVIASDMPLGLVVGDSGGRFEAWANGDGKPLGRELELAELLSFIKAANVRNVIWVTADVHYAAAHHYDPSRAQFTDFLPFWEFVAGPLHAGNFGPGKLDPTFGPEVRFHSVKPGTKANRPPTDGHQYFGTVRIDHRTRVLTTSLFNVEGTRVYSVDLNPEG